MTNTEMLEKLKDYLENDEYRSLVNILTRSKLPWWIDDTDELKYLSLQRGLGACQFIQHLGVPYKEVNEIYETFKKAVEDIIPTKEREEKSNESRNYKKVNFNKSRTKNNSRYI